jgi:hypothetical protein
LANDGSYIPDFTAVVASENIRLLQLKKADYFLDDRCGRVVYIIFLLLKLLFM